MHVRVSADAADVKSVASAIDVSSGLARELLILAGGDADLVIRSSNLSDGLDKCKARIIDARLTALERS